MGGMIDIPENPDATEGTSGPFRRAARRSLRGFLSFLELIGLRQESRAPELQAALGRFKLYHTRFRTLLSANNSFLEGLTDIERKLLGEEPFGRGFVKRVALQTVADVHQMVESLGVISGDGYPGLKQALDGITASLNSILEPVHAQTPGAIVLAIGETDGRCSDLAGGKMANLCEIRNALGLPVPNGFTVTTDGFRLLIESAGIRSLVQHAEVEITCAEDAACMSREYQGRLEAAAVPL
ncbi:MAG: hypothetical protein HY897_04940 [Deltaproteobacteria bacterium]|nr:hypothetical protein [Deltaproteobacteria bacterium]